MKKLLVLIFIFVSISMLSKIVYAQTGLVGYWKFDEGSGNIAYDSSGYGNNGSIYYAKWVGGKFGEALNFNGTPHPLFGYMGVVKINRSTSLEPVNMTIEAWVYIETLKPGTIVHKWYSTGGYALTAESNNKYRFLIGGITTKTWETLDSDVGIQTNKWTYVAATFDNSTKEMAIYVDGEKKNKTSSVMIVHASKELEIGAQWGNQGVFNGTIDEVKIYNRALSQEEINQRYQYGISVRPKIYGRLLNKTESAVQANIFVYKKETSDVVNSTQTNENGNYSIAVPEGEYDVQFNTSNFYVKIPSIKVNSDMQDIIKQITEYSPEKKILFAMDIAEPKTIQAYSEIEPKQVSQNGTALANVSSLSELKNNKWFQNYTENKLYAIATPWSVPVCGNAVCEHDEGYINCLVDCPLRCSDGTLNSTCSSNKPKYCDNGDLINKCSLCGCYSGYWTFDCLADDNCNYSQSFNVGFENPEDFQTGTNASVWNGKGTAWVLSVRPDLRFEPTTKIIYNGSQAANLTLTNPSDEGGRRLEILHDFDPRTIKEIWLQTLVYIPNGTPVDGFLAIHRPIYERFWNGTEITPYELFNCNLGVFNDSRTGRPTYQKPIFTSGCKGSVDNNFDGFNDIDGGLVWNYEGDFEVPFGQWLNITSYAYRDMTNGTFRLWYNNQLLINETQTRTIGIFPERIMALYGGAGAYDAYNSIGFSLYTDLPASPKSHYFDDIILSLKSI